MPPRRLDRRRRELAARYWPLARKLARPFKERWPWLADEFESAAGLELIQCAARYHGRVHFSTYARPLILLAMMRVLRDVSRAQERHARSIAARLSDNPSSVGDPGEDPGEAASQRELDRRRRDQVEAYLWLLSPRARRIVRMVSLEGMTTADAAARVRLSQSRVVELHRAAIEELREIADGGR